MKTCRHLKDFQITSTAIGPDTGLPPFITLCEDCAAAAQQALDRQIKRIADSKPSGKSSRASTWAWFRRVSQDIGAETAELSPTNGQPANPPNTWIVEYEIPPLRAIYHAECDADSEDQARAFITTKEPLWRIRKMTLKP